MIGTFTKNTLITTITQVLVFIFALGTSIIIARGLGPEGKGIYSMALLLSSFLMYFTNFGIQSSTVYYLGKKRYSPKEVFGYNIIYTIFLGSFAILIGLVIILFFRNSLFPGIEAKYLFLGLFLVPFQLFLPFLLYIMLGLQRFKEYNFILLFRVLVLFMFTGIFLLGFHFGIKSAIIAEILSFVIACTVIFFMVKKETKGVFLTINKNYIKDSFLYGIQSYLGSILNFLHSGIVAFLVNLLLGPLMVGFYTLSAGLSEKLWLISDAVGTVLFPRVSSENDERKKKEFTPLVFRNFLFIVILLVILLFALAHWTIVLLYSDAFIKSVQPFRILLLGAIAIAGWKILESDIKGRGKPIINTYIIGVSVVLNIVLNLFLIPKFGIIGAAWATSTSCMVNLLIALIVYIRISGNNIKDVVFLKKSDFRFYQNFSSVLFRKA